MDLIELKNIIIRGEDSHHQFKEDIKNCDSLASELAAFSNSKGGKIFIGIANDGSFVGLVAKDVDRINQLISNSASQLVRSPIAVHTENISITIDRVVIVLTVQEGISKPYFDHQGVIWLKNGSDKRRINSREELQRLFQEGGLVYADEVPTNASIKDITMALFADFFKSFYQEEFPVEDAERIKILENLSLAKNGHPTLAGLLLFGHRPQLIKPACTIKMARLHGVSITDSYLDSEDVLGSLPMVFDRALSFIMRNMHKIQNQKSVNSVGDSEVPQIVFEELLVNALIHRDYFFNAPIRLFVFDDRVEIINPGSLPNHLTVEKIRAGTSIQRNPILASFAAKGLLPYRGLGTGIRRAIKAWPHIQLIDDNAGCMFSAIVSRPKL